MEAIGQNWKTNCSNVKIKTMKNLTVIICLMLASTMVSAQTTWRIDKAHSKISFSVDHMVITEVTGQFREYEGTVVSNGDDFTDADISVTIQAASIDTDQENRDADLRSDNFFDVARYPTLQFRSSSMTRQSDGRYKLTGDLTIHGVTRTITLDVTYGGQVEDPWSNTRAGFKLTGSLDRRDFGLTYSAALETGGLVVGEEIRIVATVELIRQSE